MVGRPPMDYLCTGAWRRPGAGPRPGATAAEVAETQCYSSESAFGGAYRGAPEGHHVGIGLPGPDRCTQRGRRGMNFARIICM